MTREKESSEVLRSQSYLLPFVLGFSTFLFFLFAYQQHTIEPVQCEDGRLIVADFLYHLSVVKAFWFQGGFDVFQPQNHLVPLSEIFGCKVSGALPFAYSPISFFLWFPFALFGLLNGAAAMALWQGASVTLLSSGLLTLYRQESPRLSPRSIFLFRLLLCGVFISLSSYVALLLGQTVMAALGAGILLVCMCRDDKTRGKLSLGVILCLLLLSLKPVYFLFGLCLTVSFRRWAEIGWSLLTLLVCFVLVSAYAGEILLLSYLDALRMYSERSFPAISSDAFAFENLILFRTAFQNILPVVVIGVVERFFPLLFALTALYLAFRLRREYSSNNYFLAPLVGCFGFSLFTPYEGHFEFVFYSAFLFLALESAAARHLSRLLLYGSFFCFLIILNYKSLNSILSLTFLWAVKVAAFILLLPLLDERKLNRIP